MRRCKTNVAAGSAAALALALLLLALAPALASAATKVARYGGTVKLRNGGEGADITIAGSWFHGGGTGGRFIAGPNCENPFEFDGVTVDLTMVRCNHRSGWKLVSAKLGGGNDEIGFSYGWPWVHLRVDGGSGRDTIWGSYRSDSLSGGSGRDFIDSRGGGRDRVNCGSGSDRAKVDCGDRVKGCERVGG